MLRRMVLLGLMVVLVIGCASASLRKAREQAEIERLQLQNEALRKRVEQGIVVRGVTFEADLPIGADREVVREVLSDEAAEADIIRVKGRLIMKASAGAGVCRSQTTHHFWYDEMGREWVRGHWHNLSPYTLSSIRVNGVEREGGVVPASLKPGEMIDNLWALAGTRIYLTATKKDGSKMVGRVDFSMNLRLAGIDPHDVVGGKAYQWKVVTRY